jgi:tRNA modification GTPase
MVVMNKCDLLPAEGRPAGCLAVSCKTGDGIDSLLEELVRRAGFQPAAPYAAAINARQQACLVRARQGVAESLEELRAGHAPEYAATGLHSALDAVGEVLGATDTEEILGAIFSTFCIGK